MLFPLLVKKKKSRQNLHSGSHISKSENPHCLHLTVGFVTFDLSLGQRAYEGAAAS